MPVYLYLPVILLRIDHIEMDRIVYNIADSYIDNKVPLSDCSGHQIVQRRMQRSIEKKKRKEIQMTTIQDYNIIFI